MTKLDIKGRNLAENIRLIEDIFYYVQNYSHKGLVLLTDFRKAFDCLSWDFLFECLKRFGFKNEFCKWITTLYTNVKSCVKREWMVNRRNKHIKRCAPRLPPFSTFVYSCCRGVSY